MKKTTILPILLAAACVSQQASADTLAQWTFETLTLANTPGITPPVNNFAPEVGAGEASGLHASAATVWSTPAGNASTKAFSSTAWAVGDFYQFKVSTSGYSGVSVAFDQSSSNTGPGKFGLMYSTDGSSFTQFSTDYTVINGFTSFSFDLSAITALDNTSTVYFRLRDASTISANNGTVAAGGTDRVDNFTVTAAPISVPEPSSMALVGGFGMLALFMAARRRS